MIQGSFRYKYSNYASSIFDVNRSVLHNRAVAERMKQGQSIGAELFDTVTVYFSDVVSFTNLCSQSTPMEVSGVIY